MVVKHYNADCFEKEHDLTFVIWEDRILQVRRIERIKKTDTSCWPHKKEDYCEIDFLDTCTLEHVIHRMDYSVNMCSDFQQFRGLAAQAVDGANIDLQCLIGRTLKVAFKKNFCLNKHNGTWTPTTKIFELTAIESQ